MNTKKVLKDLKLNESLISRILGGIVILVIAIMVINSIAKRGEILPGLNFGNKNDEASQNNANNNSYVVKEGDTLWSIAESSTGSGFDWQKIADSNNITAPETLEVGQTLKLASAETSPSNPQTPATYTVAHGDSLWDIAVKTYGDGFRWTQIAEANQLTNPNLIHPGNVLTLPK